MNPYKMLFLACVFFLLRVSAQDMYTLQDVDTLTTDYSSARSINSAGSVAGQFYYKDHIVDYVWQGKAGLEVITMQALKGSYPKINSQGQVAGVMTQPAASWWQGLIHQIYLYDPLEGLKTLGIPLGWEGEKEMAVVSLNDKSQMLLANHVNVLQATKFALWANNEFKLFNYHPHVYMSALNNHSDYLVTSDEDFFFGLINAYFLQIDNYETKEFVNLTKGELHYGLGMNDNRQVIGKDKSGKKGFSVSPETGIVDLEDFIPVALNNQGDIVGTKMLTHTLVSEPAIFLRKADGTFINLTELASQQSASIPGFEKFLHVFAINDEGHILVTAKIENKEHTLLLIPQ